jgi:hypothetical protein
MILKILQKHLSKNALLQKIMQKNKQLESHFANIAHQALIDKVKTSLQDVKFKDISSQGD